MASFAADDDGEGRTRIIGTPLPAPSAVPAAQRIEALDFVRGMALFGILLINIVGFGLADAQTNPMNAGGATGANLAVWSFTQIGVEGTQRALFSMLFGASMLLLTTRIDGSGRGDAAEIYVRRNLWLIVFGFINAFVLLWFGDILYAYGIAALFLYAFRGMSGKRLIAAGIAALLLAATWNVHEARDLMHKYEAAETAQTALDGGATLTTAQEDAIYAWQGAQTLFVAVPENVVQATEQMRGGYASAFRRVAAINLLWQTWGVYRYFFDMIGAMLIGMGLFKLGVLTMRRSTRTYVAMMVIGYAVGLTVNFLETRWIVSHQFGAIAFAQANMTYDLGRLSLTVGHLGALLLFVRLDMLGALRRAVAAVGRMAVTNYLMQSAICTMLFVGLGWFGRFERYELYHVAAAICLFQLIFSVLWLRFFQFGPIEWVWRWLTYLKRPPLRRGWPDCAMTQDSQIGSSS